MPIKPDPELLTAAILGYQEQQRQIDSKIAELKAVVSGRPAETATTTPEAPARKRSAATRRCMALAQKKRWAAIKGTSPAPVMKKAPKAKRRISPEGMKRIIAATKKRWRLAKAAAKKA
jgi:peptidoglycan hydrolase CwlO-like protein